MDSHDPLSLFLPPVAHWFRATLGEPTEVQRQGWPVIAAGRHTLLLAPTGSGKTLAAFLACLDALWREPELKPGVRILYISPLKALNNDIYRNLQAPLEGVMQSAATLGVSIPRIETAVRTGDTPTAERQRLARKPPQILITTPESLNLLLTSKARETLRGVTHCIVDEIHALCPNKRGVFLALLLERLQALAEKPFVRIGLSATQRPLEEVARFLGGAVWEGNTRTPRPVSIVDAGLRKNLDLKILSPVESFGPLPEQTIWPSIDRLLAREIRAHRSTIVFANNRRAAERLTARLNEHLALGPDGEEVVATDAEPIQVRAHHGSVSLEMRQQTEQALKEGRLRAVVATASLELGIDMGAVELVCQVESPGNVARGLQRVGRAGHLVGQQSKGRLIPKTLPDLVNEAVLAREMMAGRVEQMRVPRNCLDVLAQQVVAMTAMDAWKVEDCYRLVRQAYPYADLSPAAFDAVLEMVSGRYRLTASASSEERTAEPKVQMRAMQPRISWDRVHQKLHALPGSQKLALAHGGTIPDMGHYAVVTRGGSRIGELDEEFVFERRVGDAFLLGTSAWRIDRIEIDRVIVFPAEGAPAMAPFWHGEQTGRTFDLGLAQGQFLRELQERLGQPDCMDWLQREFFLDRPAARNLRDFAQRHLIRTGALPTDRSFQIEASRDPLGDWQVLLLTPLGARLHLTLRFAFEALLRKRLGYRPQCLHHDDGVLVRLTESDEPILDLFEGLTPENLESLVLEELADSALFALRFRQNAARALLMPKTGTGQRAPLWLQRLRGRDLLQAARQFPDFPILAETFRECLEDHLDVPRVRAMLEELKAGKIEVRAARVASPSPFGASLLFSFQMAYMYAYDRTDAETSQGGRGLDPSLLDELVGGSRVQLDPQAVAQFDRRLRNVGMPPRSTAEMAEWLRKFGDLSASDLEGPMTGYLQELEADGRAISLELPAVSEAMRWVLKEEEADYRITFLGDAAAPDDKQRAGATILLRYLETHALVGLDDILGRYPFDRTWAKQQLQGWTRSGRLTTVPAAAEDGEQPRFATPISVRGMTQGTLALRRREVVACPDRQFVDFVLRWQKLHPETNVRGQEGLLQVLGSLEGTTAPAGLWESVVLPHRVNDYQPRWLDELLAGGEWLWHGSGGDHGPGDVGFLRRESIADLRPPKIADDIPRPESLDAVNEALERRGAQFVTDISATLDAPPTTVRAALWGLVRLSLATNDHFDVVRRGEPAVEAEPASRVGLRTMRRPTSRMRAPSRPEGRWSLIPWARPDMEAQALAAAHMLLDRYGVACRDLALLDSRMPPWKILYEVLSRLELSDEVRRGYFVEGLSGAQFALPEASRMLQELASPSQAAAPPILIHSLDPANLFGSGAPYPLPDERQFLRRTGNWLVLQAGQPILTVEQHGKRIASLPGVRPEQLAAAVKLLPRLLDRTGGDLRAKLVVEEWNGVPVGTSEGRDLLESAGFVRDYQAMTLYAVWR